jgi:hypothetical protein
VTIPAITPVTAATTAAVASTNGTTTLETSIKAALTSGTAVHLTNSTYTVTAPIIINVTSSSQGAIIDLGGAKIMSQIAGGGPVIEIIVGAGVNLNGLTLENFSINGNGREGDGIKIVADGTDRSITNLNISNVNIEHTGGIGLDVLGSVANGTVFNSWMHGNALGGARFANSVSGGVASGLEWDGGGFRKNGGAGLILDGGAHDMSVKGAYFVENNGPGIDATSGITSVQASGFENNQGAGAFVQGSSNFTDDTFSTYGPQGAGIAGYLASGQLITLTGPDNEYYGTGSDTTVLANVQGSGTLAIAAGGNVVAGPHVIVTGGQPILLSTTGDHPAVTSTSAISITDLYVGYYNRAPDPDGAAYWAGQLQRGMSLGEVAQSFSVQTESTNQYAFLANPDTSNATAVKTFVDSIYSNLFNRAPDAGGEAYWITQLTMGANTVGRAIINMISGAQGNDISTINNKVTLGDYYSTQVFNHDAQFTIASARAALSAVTSDASSVATAEGTVDAYIKSAPPSVATASHPEVGLVGISTGLDVAHGA